MNFLAVFVAALVPLVVGFIWYNKAVFGNSWAAMSNIPMDMEKWKKRMPMTIIVSYIVAVMLSLMLQNLVIHQFGLFSLLAEHNTTKLSAEEYVKLIGVTYDGKPVEKLWSIFRTFKHGAFHGALAGIFIAAPIIITMGLYDQKPWKLMFINIGYWVVSLIIMGGILCAWMPAAQ